MSPSLEDGLGVGLLFSCEVWACLTDWPLLLTEGEAGRLEHDPEPEAEGLRYPPGPRLYREPVLWPGRCRLPSGGVLIDIRLFNIVSSFGDNT